MVKTGGTDFEVTPNKIPLRAESQSASELPCFQPGPDISKCLLLKSVHITHITKPYYFQIQTLVKICVTPVVLYQ